MVVFGPHVEEHDPLVAPFYVTLIIHDLLLHNCMLDSGASQNLKPLTVMEQLGLQITRPYKYLYSFHSKRVKCLGMIKDLVVNLAQIPIKSVVMDIMVADIPIRFGMLISRSWGSKIGGCIKLDFSYTTIPTFGGEERILYRESRFMKTITTYEVSKNALMYERESDLSCLLFEEDEYVLNKTQVHSKIQPMEEGREKDKVWKLYFYGVNSKEGNIARVLLVSLEGNLIPLSFKLEFEATNNVTEYEALLLGLKTARNMNIACLSVYGYSQLVVKQIRNPCQTKHPNLRTYKNEVRDLIDNFFLALNV